VASGGFSNRLIVKCVTVALVGSILLTGAVRSLKPSAIQHPEQPSTICSTLNNGDGARGIGNIPNLWSGLNRGARMESL
jgi:hypothetical protein